MAELKRDFSGAKMNKDMDERVLPSGQYRDALNVQISTSEGSDVGTLQSLLGNTELSDNIVIDDYCTCIGVLPLPEKDLIYYFVAGGGVHGFFPVVKKDYIIEYNTITNAFRYVMVDIYNVMETQTVANATDKFFTISDNGFSVNTTGVRVGMHITGEFINSGTVRLNLGNNVLVTDLVKVANGWRVYHDYLWDNGSSGAAIPVAQNGTIYFHSEFGERVLNFNPLNKINNINHLDGMLFWTDGVTEPKKIHIERSMKGTGGSFQVMGWQDNQLGGHSSNTGNLLAPSIVAPYGDNANFHTRVVIDNPSTLGYQTCLNRINSRPQWVSTEHITVIKKSPQFPLELNMLETTIGRVPESSVTNPTPASNLIYATTATNTGVITTIEWADPSGDLYEEGFIVGGDTQANGYYFNSPVDYRVGDIILFTDDLGASPDSFDDSLAKVRCRVTSAPGGMPNNGGEIGPYEFKIMSIDTNTPTSPLQYNTRLDSPPPLFEFKFARFSYRWKYTDGEYSTFAPWSQVAFIPGGFDYVCKKGYNLGMVNRLKSLRLKNYFKEFHLVPDDVVQVDLLYKEDGKSTIYTVKEITKRDGSPQWPDTASSPYNRGEYDLTSEMIHAVVPSNQLLRPWDNVPKVARTQEITSNRLIYGNYKQNYELAQDLKLDVSWDNSYEKGTTAKSCKTLRTYQVGVVFGDIYGRETPVQIPTKSSSIYLEKKWSQYSNKLNVTIGHESSIPTWADYMKFYVKESANEYYNLAMDRWYDAEDGNIWLSFPSAERNKVDEETFLILKNAHDSDSAVLEDARYKIIAISNDAPLYVKTTKKNHGSIATSAQGGSAGVTFSTANEILVPTANAGGWDLVMGETWMTDVYSRAGSGSMQMRITATLTGNTMATEWQGIASIKEVSSNHVIRISKSFGDSVILNRFDGSSSPGVEINPNGLGTNTSFPTYRIEIRENVIENKAEFDGRFFVKVFRDTILQKYVLGSGEQEQEPVYNIVSSHPHRLIAGIGTNGDRNHPSVNDSANLYHRGNYAWSTNASFYNMSGSFGAGADEMGRSSAKSRTKEFWQNTPCRNEWYIDACGHGGDVSWEGGSGGGYHGNEDHNKNGVHPSHSDINGTGRGGIRHYADRTRIFWAIRKHGSSSASLGNNSYAFYQAMRSAGTLFRFRNDPNGVVYRVLRTLGHRDTENYQQGNYTQNSKKRRQFVQEIVQDVNGLPMDPSRFDVMSLNKHDGTTSAILDIVVPDATFGTDSSEFSTENPAVWETEPKENVDIDIYYEASGAIPLDVNHRNNELLIPLFSTFQVRDTNSSWHVDAATGEKITYTVTAVNQSTDADITKITISPKLVSTLGHDHYLNLYKYDGSYSTVYVSKSSGNYGVNANVIDLVTGKSPSNKQAPFGYQPWRAPHHQAQYLGWHNCWTFGNGIESNRIRDDYNAPKVANGVKASTVLAEPYSEEHRSSGLIWSGIFNSTSGVNNLNQFIMAEPITKDLSPRHGSIQKLVSRDTDTMAFCEDKVLRLLTNKDALFNADGNTNVTSTNNVIGQATPITGDYGISTNPESLAVTPFGMYWADQMRGQVLSLEGGMSIKSISDIGMKDYFNDNLEDLSEIIGTYDEKKNEYNLTLCKRVSKSQFRPTTNTISYNELTQGWVSFKSFGPELGVSLNNQYYTFREGSIWKHHINPLTNNFYGTQYYSDFTLMFNDQPGSVKSFNTINYEGSQARISEFETVGGRTDGRYDNLTAKTGWYVDYMKTDLQDVDDVEFKNKEGKWFGVLRGAATSLDNLDEKEFSVQGLGSANASNVGNPATLFTVAIHADTVNAAGSTNWDSSGADQDFKIASYAMFDAAAGSTVSAGSNYSYIDNLIYNSTTGQWVYSGLDLDAKDFNVPGGTASITGSGNSRVYIYTAASGWNADTNITKVEFTNQGIGGDSGNVVEARAYYSSFTMPSADYNKHFDVDHSGTSTGGKILRDACLHVTYEEHSADNVVIAPASPVTGITRSDNVTFLSPANNNASDQWSGTVDEGVSTKIAEYTITAATGYHLSIQGNGNGMTAAWFNRISNSAWAPYYSWTVTDTMYTSTGNTNKVQSSLLSIYYTPPVNVLGLDPDPPSGENGFCAHLHDIRISYLARPLVTVNSIGKIVTMIVAAKDVLSPGDTALVAYHSTGYTPPTDVNGLCYNMVVKLNAAQNGITHAWNWGNAAWVATTDLTGNTGPHGIGNHQNVTSQQGGGTNPYRLYQNHHILSSGGTVNHGIPMPIDASGFSEGVYCSFMEAGDFTVNGVANAPNNIDLATTVPTNINTLQGSSWEVIGDQTGSITGGGITNVTLSGNNVTIAAGRAMTAVGAQDKLDYNFTFTYTRTNSRTLSINRQPQISDFSGFDNIYTTGGSDNAGTTIHIADTTGIKVGAYIEDFDYLEGNGVNRMNKANVTKIASVSSGDSITTSLAHSGFNNDMRRVRIFTDWKFDLVTAKASINDINTIVTVTGTIRVRQFGRGTPNGTITLEGKNFITTTSN